MTKIHPFDGVTNGVMLEDRHRTCRVNYACFLAYLSIVIVCGVVVYLGLASRTMQTAYPTLQTDIHTMSVNRTKTHPLRTQIALKVTFDVPPEIKAIPQLGTFVLSKIVNPTLTLRTVVETKYNISGPDQLLFLEFEIPGFFSVNETEPGLGWTSMKLEGDFSMHAKLNQYPLFPKTKRHATFVCRVVFKNDQLDRLNHQRCI